MGRGRVALVFELDGKACFGEAADDERFVESTLKLLRIAESLYQLLWQLGIVGAQVEVISQTEVGPNGTGRVRGANAVPIGCRICFLELTYLLVPPEQGMT